MNAKTVYCEECLEDIPNSEMYWDEQRLYCGRCGSELELEHESTNVFDAIAAQKTGRLLKPEDEEFDDEEDEDSLDRDDEEEEEAEDEPSRRRD